MKISKIEKLIRTLETYPGSYNQTAFGQLLFKGHDYKHHCGTAACLAGCAVIMEGYQLWFDYGEEVTTECRKDGKIEDIGDLARRILGLDRRTAYILFDATAEGWRHQREFRRRRSPITRSRVAIAELRDLIALGPYHTTVPPVLHSPDADLHTDSFTATLPTKLEFVLELDPEPALIRA